MFSKLQYISQGVDYNHQLNNIYRALDAGCDWIQFRYKNHQEMSTSYVAEKIKTLCQKYNAKFIINDFVNIAKEVDADGVHLGLDDMSIADARKILGPDKIIGGTANTLEHVLQRIDEKCDYVGLGPFRFTTTKEKLSPILGLEGYEKIINALKKRSDTELVEVPIYAIGGIELNDIESIVDVGIHGIAVSGMITNAVDKKEIVTQINTRLYDFA